VRLILALAAACAGCGLAQDTSWMPLQTGASWTYEMSSGFLKEVVELKVVDRISVGGHAGWRLEGPAGTSDLAWTSGGLVASRLAGLKLDPPAPLLSSSAAPVPWKGVVAHQGRLFEAEGELTETAVESKDKSARRRQTTLTLKWNGETHRVETEFQWGLGILRQKHRLGAGDAIPTPALKHISGP
jgi:hypothetical protein